MIFIVLFVVAIITLPILIAELLSKSIGWIAGFHPQFQEVYKVAAISFVAGVILNWMSQVWTETEDIQSPLISLCVVELLGFGLLNVLLARMVRTPRGNYLGLKRAIKVGLIYWMIRLLLLTAMFFFFYFRMQRV